MCCFCGETFTLNAGNSEDSDGDSLEYKWTVGDDVYFGKELSVSFESEGMYTANLEVSDGLATDMDSIEITLELKEETVEEEAEEAVKEEEEEAEELVEEEGKKEGEAEEEIGEESQEEQAKQEEVGQEDIPRQEQEE